MADEIIGGVAIGVTADFSDLDAAFDAAVAKAVAEGQSIADAIAAAMSTRPDISGLTAAADTVDAAWQKLGQDMAAALGITLPTPDVSGVTAALGEVDAAAKQASGDMGQMASALGSAGSAASSAAPGLQQAAISAGDLQAKMGAAAPSVGDLAEQLARLGGIALTAAGIKAFGEAVGEALDNITRARIALTDLTGSAQQAEEMLQRLDAIGVADGLSMPGLQQAAIRMQSLLPDGSDVVGILGQVADAAAVMGTNLETAANKFALIADSGKVSDKSLAALGLSMSDLNKAMHDAGVSADELGKGAKQAFADLDQHDRIVVLQTALEKFKGEAEDIATHTFSGLWHQAIAQWDVDLGIMQKDLSDIGGKFTSLTPIVNTVSAGIALAITGIKVTVDQIVGAVTEAQAALVGVGKAAADALTGNFKKAADDLKGAFSDMSAASKASSDAIKADLASGLKTVNDLMNQTAASAKPVIEGLDGLGSHGKDAADKIAAAAAAVQKFMDQISAGGSVAQLQKDFEAASGAISKLATADLPAAINALQQYTDAQIANGASAEVIMQAFQKESQLIQQLGKIDIPAAIDAENRLVASLASAKEPLGIIQAAFEDEEKLIAKLAKDDYPDAISAQERLIKTLQDTNAPLVVLNAALQTHLKMMDDHAAAADKAAAAQEKFLESIQRTAIGIPSSTKALADFHSVMAQIGADVVDIPAKISPLNQAFIDFGINAGKAKDAVQDLHTPIGVLLTDLDNLASKAKDTGDWTDFEKALEAVDKRISDMAKTDLPEAARQLEAVVQQMINAGAPTDIVVGQLSKLEPILKKMADEDLPGANDAWQRYLALLKQVPAAIADIQAAQERQLAKEQEILAAMQKRGDAYGYILDQQAKVLQEEIHIAEQTGQDATDQVLALEKVRLKQEDLRLSAHGVADEWNKAITDLLKGFDQLGDAMAGAIVSGKNLGDALVQQFQKIAQSILGDLINAALVPLKRALIEMISSLLPDLKLGMDTGATAAKALSDAAKDAATAAEKMASSADNVAKAIDGAGSGGGLAGSVSHLTSIIGVVADVISAGAAVASTVILSHISSDTGHIEVNTRASLAELENARADAWSQFGSVYDRLGEILNDANSMRDSLLTLVTAGTGGGIGTNASNDLDSIAASSTQIADNTRNINFSIQALNQTTSPKLQILDGDLQAINSTLFMINGSILALRGTITQSSQSLVEQMNAMQMSGSATGRAIASAIDGASGDANSAAQQVINNTAAAVYAAHDVAGQITALQAEYQAYETLIANALQAGDVALATQYQQAAQAVMRQIGSLEEGQNVQSGLIGNLSDAIYQTSSGTTTAVGSASDAITRTVTYGANGIVNAVVSSAAMISAAVSSAVTSAGAAAGASVNKTVTQPGVMGTGGATPYTGVPNGPVESPGWTPPPGTTSTGSQVPQTPVYPPGSGKINFGPPNTADPSGIISGVVRPSTAPETGTTPANTPFQPLPMFATGGYAAETGVGIVEKGEYVLNPDQVDRVLDFLNPPTNVAPAQAAPVDRPDVLTYGRPGAYTAPGPALSDLGGAIKTAAQQQADAQAAATQQLKDQLMLLQYELSAAISNAGANSPQAQELQLQIAALLKQINGADKQIADSTSAAASAASSAVSVAQAIAAVASQGRAAAAVTAGASAGTPISAGTITSIAAHPLGATVPAGLMPDTLPQSFTPSYGGFSGYNPYTTPTYYGTGTGAGSGASVNITAPITVNGVQDGATLAKTLVLHLKRTVAQGGLTS